MKKLEKDILIRTLKLILGLMILGLGAAFFLYSGLGADPNSVFIEGLGVKLNISYGTASLIINSVLAFIVFVFKRTYLNIATIGNLFITGYSADFFVYLFGKLGLNNTYFPFQLIYIGFSLVILSFAIAFYINQRLGIGAMDAMPQIISDKTGKSFATTRRALDILALVAGILLGGTFGIGTIIMSLGTGPMVGFYRRKFGFTS